MINNTKLSSYICDDTYKLGQTMGKIKFYTISHLKCLKFI